MADQHLQGGRIIHDDDGSTGRWEHLVQIAFQLAETVDDLDLRDIGDKSHSPDKRVLACLEALDDLLEVFPSDIDPVEDLPGYGLRRLMTSLRRALCGLPAGPGASSNDAPKAPP